MLDEEGEGLIPVIASCIAVPEGTGGLTRFNFMARLENLKWLLAACCSLYIEILVHIIVVLALVAKGIRICTVQVSKAQSGKPSQVDRHFEPIMSNPRASDYLMNDNPLC